ncbi:glycosyltransferase [Halodesulfurarchaeum sp. HSR-GB]|uniref:glycosyltransferase n=1 Tax=Halodesulfurarchaeum sp. HSR-GB TaxID=3074077 RepID=UPI002855F205|nr:glycosyltransferase [Halodesulfurarchaeum sp. HSR-GB]MDR5657392.1 glycosyltransferase [Halodesulfurarchaeum sp. HSR-GB]
MNIVYYLGTFPKLSKSFILNEIYELKQRGHNVGVCALWDPNEDIRHEELHEINIPIQYVGDIQYNDIAELFSRSVVYSLTPKNVFYPASPQQHAANLVRAKRCIDFIKSLSWKPDHIHSHFATLPKFGGKYVASYYDIPFTLTTHAFDIYKQPVGAYTRRLIKSTDRVITISEYNKKYIQDQITPSIPIDIVRAGIRPEKFTPTDTLASDRILTIARFVEKKGLEYAIDAVGIVADELPEIDYHLIGSGQLELKLKEKVVELGIEENVTFLDNVSDKRLISELDEASCFLLPSVIAESGDRDGIPVALMEAMAMETPPVSTTVSGIPELIDDGKNGLLVEPRNERAIAEALLKIFQNEPDRQVLSEHARQRIVENFNMKNEAAKLIKAFKNTQIT